MKSALVCGGGGFIGSHVARRLKKEGFWVRAADLKHPEFSEFAADDFVIADLRDQSTVNALVDRHFDEVYQLAADMGGAGYLFTGTHDADIMRNSALITLNLVEACRKRGVRRFFFSSSACVYPKRNQEDPDAPLTVEDSVYPADPDSEYGWEKLFAERVLLAYNRTTEMECRIARYHNVYGPEGTWTGGREKVPAALCRKVAEASDGSEIEIWGDGMQSRSFLYVDDCVEATLRLTRSPDFAGPVNIGSEEMVTINELAGITMKAAGKTLSLRHVAGPQGVRGRNSHNELVRQKLGWVPSFTLHDGIALTYRWIAAQVESRR